MTSSPSNNKASHSGHIPVLFNECMDALTIQPQYTYVDATLGGGGHARGILDGLNADGTLIGFDQDSGILEQTKAKLTAPNNSTIITIHSNFSHIKSKLEKHGITSISGGILADIGVSSFQLDQGERGFSFNKDAPLDMRMDTTQKLTAERIVNTYKEVELVRVFSEYGEERFSKTIARRIVEERAQTPYVSTRQLANLIESVSRKILGHKPQRIHPATKVFQALRIEVNDELGVLESFLNQAIELLAPQARIAVISFHSLEDRIVKNVFRDNEAKPKSGKEGTLKLISRKPLTATDEEIARNPRSRSAKLRVAEKLDNT